MEKILYVLRNLDAFSSVCCIKTMHFSLSILTSAIKMLETRKKNNHVLELIRFGEILVFFFFVCIFTKDSLVFAQKVESMRSPYLAVVCTQKCGAFFSLYLCSQRVLCVCVKRTNFSRHYLNTQHNDITSYSGATHMAMLRIHKYIYEKFNNKQDIPKCNANHLYARDVANLCAIVCAMSHVLFPLKTHSIRLPI